MLDILPAILQQYKETRHGSPGVLGENYTGEDGILRNDTCHEEWDKILDQMIFLFREAYEPTCSKKNPLEDEFYHIYTEFIQKYGIIGERLRTEEELAEDEKNHYTTAHFPSELPEYADTLARYDEEQQKLEAYQDECKDKAFELLSKWFWELQD